MLNLAITFIIIALIAFVLGATGIASFATNVAYVLVVIGLILFVINFLSKKV